MLLVPHADGAGVLEVLADQSWLLLGAEAGPVDAWRPIAPAAAAAAHCPAAPVSIITGVFVPSATCCR